VTHMRDVLVDCADVTESLSRGEPLSEGAAAHANGCPICSALLRPTVAPTAEETLFAAVQTEVHEEHGVAARLRSLPSGLRVFAAAGWAALLVTATTLVTPRSAFGPIPFERVTVVIASLVALITLALWLGLRPLQTRPAPRRLLLVSSLSGMFAPALFAMFPLGAARVESVAHVGSLRATLGCFFIGAVAGGLLVAGLRALDRSEHRSWSSALLAAAAGGLLGNAALELHCPITAPAHLFLGHVTVGVALLAGYAWIRRATSRT
jgi:hypothetical protein